jgi:release factor glutamine methyltransferase
MGEYPEARGVGVDLSPDALAVAQKNGAALGRFPLWVLGSWGESLGGRFDIILSNPPYIATEECHTLDPNVRLFDPWMALDGGDDGLVAYRALMPQVRDLLTPGGHIFLEIGHTQAATVAFMAKENGLQVQGIEKDLENRDRCVILSL